MSEYDIHVDVDGDGEYDEVHVTEHEDGSATITADTNHDGQLDFSAEDYDGDRLVDIATYDTDYDGQLDTEYSDNDGDGYLDSSGAHIAPSDPGEPEGSAASDPEPTSHTDPTQPQLADGSQPTDNYEDAEQGNLAGDEEPTSYEQAPTTPR